VIEVVSASDPVARLAGAFTSGSDVLVVEHTPPAEAIVERLRASLAGDGVGSASPVPAPAALVATTYDMHSASPPAPTLALPCRILCAFSAVALATTTVDASITDADALVVSIAEQMLASGWRHVACPGVAMRWDPAADAAIKPVGGWSARSLASITSDANSGLEAHRSWAEAQTDRVRVVIDGVCMTTQPYTGTQHLVLEVARWMKAVRPACDVVVAVKAGAVQHVTSALGDAGVEVVERRGGLAADVLYRPYQMLFARELEFVRTTGRRCIVGQLDMIGFSNPGYHPSEQLFFFARNLQRYLMRLADAVTFISRYGLESAYAELPDLDRQRLHVVSCGADPIAQAGALRPDRDLVAGSPFLVCLSSTFWHKHRMHGIATLAALVERHGYGGHLVIAGPEPYYGRSTAAEEALIGTLPAHIAGRIHRWGHIDESEKWWLLEHADAALYPSIVEGFGFVPFESAAAGTPCLAFDGTAQAELLGGTQAVVASWEPATWADRVATWIEQPSAAASAVDAIRRVAQQHTWERCARSTWSAIDSALAAPRRAPATEDGDRLPRVANTSLAPASAAMTALRFDVARGVPAVRRRAIRLARRIAQRTAT
jgi:glycosyltransferase involved in cell wall biosynthesis